MKREFHILIEEDQDGMLVASVPELKGCHTQAKSLDELMVRVREAIELCLEVDEISMNIPRFVGIQRMSIEI